MVSFAYAVFQLCYNSHGPRGGQREVWFYNRCAPLFSRKLHLYFRMRSLAGVPFPEATSAFPRIRGRHEVKEWQIGPSPKAKIVLRKAKNLQKEDNEMSKSKMSIQWAWKPRRNCEFLPPMWLEFTAKRGSIIFTKWKEYYCVEKPHTKRKRIRGSSFWSTRLDW